MSLGPASRPGRTEILIVSAASSWSSHRQPRLPAASPAPDLTIVPPSRISPALCPQDSTSTAVQLVQHPRACIHIRMPDPVGMPGGELVDLRNLPGSSLKLVEEHVSEVEPGNVKQTFAGVGRA